MQSNTERFQQCKAYSKNKWKYTFTVNTRNETKRFTRKLRVKLCFLGIRSIRENLFI
jgi:hypothetical protein